MVEFCDNCKSSLPKADLTIAGGELFPSHDYICPFCNEPSSPKKEGTIELPLPSDKMDIVIGAGKAAEADLMPPDNA